MKCATVNKLTHLWVRCLHTELSLNLVRSSGTGDRAWVTAAGLKAWQTEDVMRDAVTVTVNTSSR